MLEDGPILDGEDFRPVSRRSDRSLRAVEETADTMYVVVPFVPQAGQELSDSALEMVAGGKGGDTYSCNEAKGGFNTRVEFSANVSV